MSRSYLAATCGLLLASGFGTRAVDPPKADAAPAPPVRSLVYSPDGKVLVAGAGKRDQPGVLLAWDGVTLKPRWQRNEPEGFTSVSFAPGGKELAVACGKTVAQRIDASTGRELGEVGPHPATVRAVVHLPGTGLLATGSDGTIRLWDLKTGKVAKELKGGHPAEVTSLVASPDGK